MTGRDVPDVDLAVVETVPVDSEQGGSGPTGSGATGARPSTGQVSSAEGSSAEGSSAAAASVTGTPGPVATEAGAGSSGGASDATGEPEKAAPTSEGAGRAAASGRNKALVGLAALCALLAVAAIVLGVQLRDREATKDTREAALAAARQSAINLTSVEAQQFDTSVQRVLDGATGEFRKEFEENSAKLKDLLAKNEVSADGKVLEAGLVRSDDSNATALVVVDSFVRNVASPEGRTNTYRMQIEVERVDDRWLTSSLRFVG